ncbi:tRNA lysidine(34) synthetase TilS [Paenibacillus daejeonensis]|uniref:tRNA lysidine(34) synthetase TilS n=1 Tax=Paenibacillus daejeonensis TaxID=135193 RepID=UPI000368B915|nr:tRNA lysidine(34) synthetase TilS [Paenibacillus daejeonensis]
MNQLLNEISATAAREGLWRAGERILVAVSGGPDSVALLHILSQLAERERFLLTAAHIHHGLRQASDQEAEAVQQLCQSLSIACEYERLDVPAHKQRSGLSTQLAARELRYRFLHETAERIGASRIALGHHADDQAETVLMRVLRGTGLSGLAGMKMRRSDHGVELIRPLLAMPKSKLIEYCEVQGLIYSEDASNTDRHYLRNALRLDVMPQLQTYNPELREALCRLGEMASQEDDLLQSQTEQCYKRLVRPEKDGLSMDRQDLLGLHVALQRRLIKLILYYLSPERDSTSYERVEAMRMAVADESQTTWRTDAGDGIRFAREYERLHWLRSNLHMASEVPKYQYEVSAHARELIIRETDPPMVFSFHSADAGSSKPANRYEAVFDVQALHFPLTIRNRRPGDRMAVLGLEGTKKVQDMFVDDKIPPSQRGTLPIVCDADGKLLWIPGIRRSSHALAGLPGGAELRIRVQFA